MWMFDRLDNETHVYTEGTARFIYGYGKNNQGWSSKIGRSQEQKEDWN